MKTSLKTHINRSRFISSACSLVLITAMVAASEALRDPEIIFPEIAALALGYCCAPARKWVVNSSRMVALISICAVIGLLISRAPGSQFVKVASAFVLAQFIYLYSRTTLAPLISAIVLPVLIGSQSPVYVCSAVTMAIAVAFLHEALVKKRLTWEEPYTPLPRPGSDKLVRAAIRAIFVIAFAWLAFKTGWKFMIAPPLLVAFTELSETWRPGTPARPHRVVLLVTTCALIGAVSRLAITIYAGFPLTIAALVATTAMLLLIHKTHLYIPPAAAMTILAMLIPESAILLYPLQVAVGITTFMLTSMAFYRAFGA